MKNRIAKKAVWLILKNIIFVCLIILGQYIALKVNDTPTANYIFYGVCGLLFLYMLSSDLNDVNENLEIEVIRKLKDY